MMSPELVTAALKMIGVLILILGGLAAFNFYSKRFLRGRVLQKSIRILESTPLGLKKSITLVQVPGAVLVLGITHDRIALLERMDEQTYAERSEANGKQRMPSFQDHLVKMTGAWQRRQTKSDTSGSADPNPC